MDPPGNWTGPPVRFPSGSIELVQPPCLILFTLLTSTYFGSPDDGSFILLKYKCRGGGSRDPRAASVPTTTTNFATASAISSSSLETDNEEDNGDNEPLLDIEFILILENEDDGGRFEEGEVEVR